MTIRSDITVDWLQSPRIITVAAPSTELDLQDLVDTLRELEEEFTNLCYPHLVDSAGKESLGGGVYVAITLALQSAKVMFEARAGPSFVQCTISGGNLVAYDANGDSMSPIQPSDYTQVVMAASSSATLIDRFDGTEGIELIRKFLMNRQELFAGSQDNLIIYDDDDETVIATQDVTDADGNAIVMPVGAPAKRSRAT